MPMAVMDSIFMGIESREHPTHFAKLQLFEPPPGAAPEFVSEFYRSLLSQSDVDPMMRRRPVRRASSLGQWGWTEDEEVDLEYHVRLSGLPNPGRVRELLEVVSRLHGALLDRHRPWWECYVIGGLADGRFAVYTKLHHALMDGVAAMQRLTAGLTTDPNGTVQPPWSPQGGPTASRGSSLPGSVLDRVWATGRLARNMAAARPFQAPKSMLKVKIVGSAARSDNPSPVSKRSAASKRINAYGV